MGRGRAKAKQTKVARALKYGGPQTDLERLQRELAGGPGAVPFSPVDEVEVLEDEDDLEVDDELYAKYLSDDDEDEDDDER